MPPLPAAPPPPWPLSPPPPSLPPLPTSAALASLYLHAGGGAWSSHGLNWMSGEPCVDGWSGVTCCPETHPHLSRWPGGSCRVSGVGGPSEDEQPPTSAASSAEARAAACASGTSHGNTTDAARCVVVAVELPSSALRGDLNGSLDDLPWLQALDLSDNALGGTLPLIRAAHGHGSGGASGGGGGGDGDGAPVLLLLTLDGNGFEYVDTHVATLVEACRGDAECAGIPPTSCRAFGREYVVRLSDHDTCVKCAPLFLTALLYGALLGAFLLGVGVYVYMVLQHHTAIDDWINTAAIFVCHAQTLSIVGLLQLGWPRSTERLMDSLALDMVNVGEMTAPECLVQAFGDGQRDQIESMGGTFFVVSVTRMTLVAALLFTVTIVQLAVKRCTKPPRKGDGGGGRGLGGAVEQRQHINDTLEMVETIVFSAQVTISVRLSVQMMVARRDEDAGGVIGFVGFWVAVLTVLMQLLFMAKYALNMRSLLRKQAADGHVRGGLLRAPSFLPEILVRRASLVSGSRIVSMNRRVTTKPRIDSDKTSSNSGGKRLGISDRSKTNDSLSNGTNDRTDDAQRTDSVRALTPRGKALALSAVVSALFAGGIGPTRRSPRSPRRNRPGSNDAGSNRSSSRSGSGREGGGGGGGACARGGQGGGGSPHCGRKEADNRSELVTFRDGPPTMPSASTDDIQAAGAPADAGTSVRSEDDADEKLWWLGRRWDRLAAWLDAKTGWMPGGGKLPPTRLRYRLSFLTDRFRDEAPHWQFVVWCRQAGLIVAVSLPEILGEPTSKPLLYVASGLAMAVLAVSLLLQLSAQPYTYAFQNSLEVYLILSSILIVGLGVGYTFVVVKSVVIEYLLIGALFGSLILGALYLLVQHCCCSGQRSGRIRLGGARPLVTRPVAAHLPSAVSPAGEQATKPSLTSRLSKHWLKRLSSVQSVPSVSSDRRTKEERRKTVGGSARSCVSRGSSVKDMFMNRGSSTKDMARGSSTNCMARGTSCVESSDTTGQASVLSFGAACSAGGSSKQTPRDSGVSSLGATPRDSGTPSFDASAELDDLAPPLAGGDCCDGHRAAGECSNLGDAASQSESESERSKSKRGSRCSFFGVGSSQTSTTPAQRRSALKSRASSSRRGSSEPSTISSRASGATAPVDVETPARKSRSSAATCQSQYGSAASRMSAAPGAAPLCEISHERSSCTGEL